MIEFKAPCGHSVRAKDSDAGNMVKCRYCGRVVQVPLADNQKLEALLGEPDAPRPAAAPKPGLRYRQTRAPTRLIKALLGLIYVVVAVVALAFGLKLVLDRVQLHKTAEPQTPAGQHEFGAESSAQEAEGPPGSPNPYAECAQLKLGESGLVLRSVPIGARVYLAGPEQDKTPEANPTRNSSLFCGQTPLVRPDLQPGRYRVGFSLPINARQLRRWSGYLNYRREVEEKGRRDLDYFLPDDADGAGIDDPGNGPLLIYRTYPAVLRSAQWSVVIGLFLPALPTVEYLGQLPTDTRFEFRDQDARDELRFYGVPQDQAELFISALQRIGKIVWTDPAGHPRMFFQIQPNGEVWSVRLAQGAAAAGPHAGLQPLARDPSWAPRWPALGIEATPRPGPALLPPARHAADLSPRTSP